VATSVRVTRSDDGFAGFWGQNVVLRNVHACHQLRSGRLVPRQQLHPHRRGLIERNGGCGIADVMSCTTIYRNTTVRDNYPMGVLFQGFSHAMYGCRIVGNRGPQVEVSRGAAVSLGNCLIVGSGPQGETARWGSEYGRVDHCTILNSFGGYRRLGRRSRAELDHRQLHDVLKVDRQRR